MGLPPHLRAAQAAKLRSTAEKSSTVSEQAEPTNATTSHGRLSGPAQAMARISAALATGPMKTDDWHSCSGASAESIRVGFERSFSSVGARSTKFNDGRSSSGASDESTRVDNGHSPSSAGNTSSHQIADETSALCQESADSSQEALPALLSNLLSSEQYNAPPLSQTQRRTNVAPALHLEQAVSPSETTLVPYPDTESDTSFSGGELEQCAVSLPIANPWLVSGRDDTACESAPTQSKSTEASQVEVKLDIMAEIVKHLDTNMEQLTEQNKQHFDREEFLATALKQQTERIAELEARMSANDSRIAHEPSSLEVSVSMSDLNNHLIAMEDRLHALVSDVADVKSEHTLLRSDLMVVTKSMMGLVQSQIEVERKQCAKSTADGPS